MKSFFQLGTMPEVGDLIMRIHPREGQPRIYMVVEKTPLPYGNGHVYKVVPNQTFHPAHLQSYYAPLSEHP
jgi:hypothetical protein